MATKLEKEVTRETSVISENRNVIITLTEYQKISLRLKGMKSGGVEISIENLYDILTKTPDKSEKAFTSVIIDNTSERKSDDYTFSLTDFRSQYLISREFDLDTKTKLESITTKLLNEIKNNKFKETGRRKQ